MRRLLKVTSTCQYRNKYGKDVELPVLRLQGRWLERAGFTRGSRVEIVEGNGTLTIKKVEDIVNNPHTLRGENQ